MTRTNAVIKYLESWSIDADIKKNKLATTVIKRATQDLRNADWENKITIRFLTAMVIIETIGLVAVGLILA